MTYNYILYERRIIIRKIMCERLEIYCCLMFSVLPHYVTPSYVTASV